MQLTDSDILAIAGRMYPIRDTVKALARKQLRKLYEGLSRIGAIEASGVTSVEMVTIDDDPVDDAPVDIADFQRWPDFDDLAQ